MLQLELDPRFMPSERSAEEIELYRSTILRSVIKGGDIEWRKEKRFRPISFDSALSSLLASSYHNLGRQSNAEGYELDLLVGQALKKALPYLQGERGNFESFFHFKNRMFMSMLEHMVIDHHRSSLRHLEDVKKPDNQLPRGAGTNRAEGFQPTLFRLSEEQTKVEKAMESLLADLQNPDAVMRPEYVGRLPRYRQRALELRFQYPDFSSTDIAKILELEGYRRFASSAIRVWVFRVKKARKQQLTGVS
ncbi:hypothetical protein A3B45_03585 [Candidatus Daviesbacteria bacterium RIFCSPLOWO2_01_FULL_39_12]|uniref:Uncharacterized protein n=1 Tax=Candidatus Daviesbacteria bacterium RIFCSPLOWO2_01_FULL_39_12 TaxID=1797785 RepID=A0A1F5KU38_9BACT|nr:MAG: hypothetical protein A3B45_03585 [Candidatus Daviesbacteria bacterium RIFCSPLOWO2_01_FULL_39_12]